MIFRAQPIFPFRKMKGMTIIEGLILLSIFIIVAITFYEGFILSTNHILNAKRRLLAVGIANEKMEILRSLPYDEVAVLGGLPSGAIDQDESIAMSGGQFHILTAISYFDDPDDGTLASGTDSIPNDYKFVVIRVLWGGETAAEAVILRSFFVPSGIETTAGGGILSINVIDANGIPVQNASVRIQNSSVAPAVDTTLVTGADGNAALVGAKASSQKYIITVSKSGYETVTTLPPYPITAFYPNDVHMTAINDVFTTSIIISSLLANLHIEMRNPLGVSVPDINFDLEGGRVIGTTTGLAPVYGYSESLVTDSSSGNKDIMYVSPWAYYLNLNEVNYTFWKADYGSNNAANQIVLAPGGNLTATVFIINKNLPGYFVKVLDKSNGNPVEGGVVKLENTGLGYNVEKATDSYGYAYIPRDAAETLINGTTYNITVTHTDYDTKTDTVTINNLTNDIIELEPN
jgi:hypothetical protein